MMGHVVTGNLPAELSGFVGRREEVAQAKRLVRDHRLVTLTGVGGVGKTRLAQRVAGQLLRGFRDGAWFVDLAEVRDPDLLTHQMHDPELLAHVIATTAGLRTRSARRPLDVLTDHLADRRPLLVLDNCEHLVDAVAVLVDALLRGCPRVHVMATSREPLRVDGERILPVPPLPVPGPDRRPGGAALSDCASVALFVARAAAAVPGFRLTAANEAVVAEICRRLDGLPLAIELAAARVPVLAPEQIEARLADRFRLLRRGARTAAERQQTLRACVDWSYELCSKPERRLWRQLAIFAGGVEADTVAGVCQIPDAPVEDLLGALTEKSVVLREDGRYRLLETIRAYGLAKLADRGEQDALRRRHRDWYEGLVIRASAEWISDRQAYWLARLEREHPNLRAAIEYCLTTPGEAECGLRVAVTFPSLYWWSRGLFSEGHRWLDRALAQTGAASTLRARALLLAGRLAYGRGDADAGARLLAEGEALARRLDAPAELALAAFVRGTQALFGRDFPTAVSTLERALALLDPDEEPDLRLHTLFTLVAAAGLAGDAARADARYRDVLAITEPRGEVFHRSNAMWARGVAAWRQGDAAAAGEYQMASLRLKRDRRLDDPLGTMLCLEALAWTAAGQRQHRRAATLFGAAEAIRTDLDTSITVFRHLTPYHEDGRAQTRDALGEASFEEGWRKGQGLTRERAVALALYEHPPPATAPSRGRSRPPATSPSVAAPRPPAASRSPAMSSRPTASPSPATSPPPATSSPAATSPPPPLSRREEQVAVLVARGLSNRQIASTLVISPRTAESHVQNVLSKLGFASRAQIAAWAVEYGLASP